MTTTPDKEIKIKLGITLGDINGIGPEIIIKTFSDPRMAQVCTPVIYGSSKIISYYRKVLNNNEFTFNPIRNVNEVSHKKINIINCWEDDVKIDPGQPTETSGKYAFKSLEAAVEDLVKKRIDALVTAPINKHNMQQPGFEFAGHTEYLAQKCETGSYLMFLISDNLKVGTVTGHIALRQVSDSISTEKIVQKIRVMNDSLKRDFSIRKPRIAVLGLNPHAGDNGLLGNEDKEIIEPAVKKASDDGIMAYGPYAADGFFGSDSGKKFDAVLAMYHDQGLIPFKTIAFSNGVNFTAGLPVIRTSPDHGTAYDLVGKNTASEESFRESVYAACDIFKRRQEYSELTANPLQKMSRQGADQ